MVVRDARDDAEALFLQRGGERLGILHDLCGVFFEGGLQRFFQGDGLRRDDVHQGAALDAGEDRLVELCAEFRVLREDHAAPRAAKRLVRRRRHDIRPRQRAWMHAARDESRDVRHVDHEVGADRLGDGGEPLEVDDARIGGSAGDDELRLDFLRLLFQRIVVDALCLFVHAIGDDVEVLARHVDGAAVREVSAVREIHAHVGVAGRKQREEHRHVRLCARVRLHVDIACAEQLFRTLDGKRLNDVDALAAAVVALARVALGVLVREHASLRLHDRVAHDVLRSDQLKLVTLARKLRLQRRSDLRIGLLQRIHQCHTFPS